MSTDAREHPQDRDQDRGEPPHGPATAPHPGPDDAPTSSPPDEAIVFDGDAQTGPYPGPRRRP